MGTDLHRLLRMSLATWLVAIVPALVHELPVLRMSFGPEQSAAIIGQAGLALAVLLLLWTALVFGAAVLLLRLANISTRLTATSIVGATLAIIATPALYRTATLWLEPFWKPAYPIPPAVEVSIWLVCLGSFWVLLRWERFHSGFDRAVTGAAQFSVLALVFMLVAWALWSPNYFGDVPSLEVAGNNNQGARPNIILITIDTLSARNTSLHGYGRETTPNLDRFAGQAVVFTDAISGANFTTPGIAAILTGRHATRNGIHHLSSRLPPEDLGDSVPGQLHRVGYQLAGFVGNNWAHPANFSLDPFFDVLPFTEMRNPFAWPYVIPTLDSRLNGMGLWHFLFYPWTVRLGYLPWWNSHSPFRAEEVLASASEFLATRADDRPLFLWVHIFPPHGPYLPPSPYKGRFLQSDDMQTFSEQERILFGGYGYRDLSAVNQLRDRYDENISYVDERLGQFLDFLASHGILESSYLIITSDHGESFEKGWRGHDIPALHQALIHVPLIVHRPGSGHGQRLELPVQTVDVAATILDAAGIEDIPDMDGRSLLSVLDGGLSNSADPLRYAMYIVDTPDQRCPETGLFAVLDGKRKLIWDRTAYRVALYDLNTDAGELTDISSSQREYVAYLKNQVEQDLLHCDKFRSDN